MKKSHLTLTPSFPYRQKRRKKRAIVATTLGLCALVSGATFLHAMSDKGLGELTSWNPFEGQGLFNKESDADSLVLELVSLPTSERIPQLEAIASGTQSLGRSRARYMLASESIEQKQGQKALSLLEGLEKKYKVLAPYVLLKRSQAYEVSGDKNKAQEALREILENYPESPVAAEALYILGNNDETLWEQAIAQFPSHPRTIEIVQRKLKQNPDQPQLILLLVKYAPETPGMVPLLDKLVAQYEAQLKPEEWEAIASIYWGKQEYGKASSAYMGAEDIPKNAYLVAQALDKSGSRSEAKSSYDYVLTEFPTSPEAAKSLLALAKDAQTPDALAYLDRVINDFPDLAGDALKEKVKIFEQLNDLPSAQQARDLLLTKYANSEGAAEYRWTQARAFAAAGNVQGAIEWAKPIATQNPKSSYGPRAAFWTGKWANILGQQSEAREAFEKAIKQYPQSYYAWRSAVFLGWNVGDFNTVRDIQPEVVRSSVRSLPPAGSETFKELYQIGQDRDAWTLWQAEFTNPTQPTVAEQFTDGLMHLKVGKYLSAIDRVAKLEDRETPEEQAEYEAFKQDMAYWHALYPLPYKDLIQQFSQERQINPLLVAALIRQESKFERKISSIVGASGLMQIMPATAAAVAKEINLPKYSLSNPKDNIQLGTSYLDTTHRHYDNNSMLAVASYNAGPGNVSKWLREKQITDPDEFVEAIPFDETNFYVKNVFGNYWNYLRLYNPEISQQLAQFSGTQKTARR